LPDPGELEGYWLSHPDVKAKIEASQRLIRRYPPPQRRKTPQ
jgi:hypothetical protein